MVKMHFFNEVSPLLKGFIRYYWYVKGEEREPSGQILLPMDHVDLIINIGYPFFYGKEERICQLDSIHFHGIRESSLEITQPEKVEALGVSFTPWGFYFFTKQSMSQYINRIVNLNDVNHLLREELFDHVVKFEAPSEFVKAIEKTLIKCINAKDSEQIDCRIIKEFIESDGFNIKEFCEANRISIRRLERIFRKYIGISPKRFMNLVRFEESARDVMYDNQVSLTDISHKHGYYDQAHFVKAFKSYTSYAPINFRLDKPALKSQLDYE